MCATLFVCLMLFVYMNEDVRVVYAAIRNYGLEYSHHIEKVYCPCMVRVSFGRHLFILHTPQQHLLNCFGRVEVLTQSRARCIQV